MSRKPSIVSRLQHYSNLPCGFVLAELTPKSTSQYQWANRQVPAEFPGERPCPMLPGASN